MFTIKVELNNFAQETVHYFAFNLIFLNFPSNPITIINILFLNIFYGKFKKNQCFWLWVIHSFLQTNLYKYLYGLDVIKGLFIARLRVVKNLFIILAFVVCEREFSKIAICPYTVYKLN